MKKVNPLEDKILVKVIKKQQETTSSGIVIPEVANKEKPMLGEVKAIGDSEMIKVKVGDIILFTKFAGTEIKINNEDHLVLTASDVLATIEL